LNEEFRRRNLLGQEKVAVEKEKPLNDWIPLVESLRYSERKYD
jgi:hypothetical protein